MRPRTTMRQTKTDDPSSSLQRREGDWRSGTTFQRADVETAAERAGQAAGDEAEDGLPVGEVADEGATSVPIAVSHHIGQIAVFPNHVGDGERDDASRMTSPHVQRDALFPSTRQRSSSVDVAGASTSPGMVIQRQPATTADPPVTNETAPSSVATDATSSDATPLDTVPKPIQTIKPRSVTTPYATFQVYPDTYKGPFPTSDFSAGNWPVKEAVYAHVDKVIGAISGGSGRLKVDGPQSFKVNLLHDLSWLLTVSVGGDLLDAIFTSGKHLTFIDSGGAGNVTAAIGNPDDGNQRPNGRPGPGCDAKLAYNPTEWNPYGGSDDWMNRPPAIGMAHELIHAWAFMTGNTPVGQKDGIEKGELQAVGLGTYSDAAFTENKFRGAFGLPARPVYK